MNLLNQIQEALGYIQSQGVIQPEVGIILGTGLGNLASKINTEVTIDYSLIPHFSLSTVEFHKGKLIYGTLAGKKVIAMQGRFHLYEGYTVQQVTFPVRVMKMLGIRHLLISNAAGGLNPIMKQGSLMIIDDHINLQPFSPLAGPNDDNLGPRFPDMSSPYDPEMIKEIES